MKAIEIHQPKIIESTTARLYIRTYKYEDFFECLSLYSDPELIRFFDNGKPRTLEEVKSYIKERGTFYEETGQPFGLFSVFLGESNTFIGQIDLVPTGVPGEVEIGWILKKEFQNQGYCSEAILSFLIPYTRNLSKKGIEACGKPIDTIMATAHPENIPSQRIILKSGLSFYKSEPRYNNNPRNWYKLQLG